MESWAAALVLAAGAMGACGVAAGAAGAHSGAAETLGTASIYLLVHAAAVTGIALGRGPDWLALVAATALAAGTAIFAGDLAARALAGARLFPMAAPAGGMIMIAGWLLLALVALKWIAGGHR